ncbi:ABC transporter [Lachnoclostridium sp. An196]|uniref:ABC transporter ATP-binding protein n=1 Tax=Lachnoclostridium sp. An196 TaxID=1965583 RepID=UPI000B39B76B|nr:ABC transporter ATP-binding protein [Lachnoclostridium sp. An196]OUP22319.1 ABC transporter [Lachnoclostridium sp. An196]
MIKTLISQVGEYKKVSLLTPLFTALEVLMEILIPFITASIIDKGIEAGDMRQVCFYGAIMLILAFLSLTFGVLAGRYAAAASAGFACNLREGMYKNIQTFSFSNIDKFSTAGLVTRMTTDVTNLQMAYQMCLRIAVRSPLMLVCSMAMCFFINVRLSAIFLVAMVVLGCGLFFIMSRTTRVFREVFRKYDELNASVQENVAAIRVVKAFVREIYENEKFRKAADRLYKLFVKAEGTLAFNSPLMMLVVYGCIISLSWFGAHFVVAGSLTTGELTSMFSYIMSVLMSLMMLSMIFVMLTMSMASGERIAEVLNEKADLANPVQPVMEIEDGSIDFNHVGFSYKHGSGEETLHDIDLHIKSGETIGIIGGTGCGKSSLVSLISRLYDVTSGSVYVGGKDVRSYDMETLRNQVAVVLQKNVLFSGTILDNLRWGKEDATEEECIEVCRQACADEFIERFPDRYNTWIEQGGNNVSGGQKQRLCIARALLKKPKVLILDDSTSAVDTATDARIREAFAKKIPGTTKLIIAQRISSVQDADRIVVLDDGRIGGIGTHRELLENNKIYKEIYEAQSKGGGDFDHPGKEG